MADIEQLLTAAKKTGLIEKSSEKPEETQQNEEKENE